MKQDWFDIMLNLIFMIAIVAFFAGPYLLCYYYWKLGTDWTIAVGTVILYIETLALGGWAKS